jgi:oligoendopeptidase F
LKVLGEDYSKELSALLEPANGRMDIVGDSNRIPIRGTASVYPVYPSIFFAYNYEGFLIDMTLLAHEAGHAVQASLMERNGVPMYYAAGPGYFTESFGKFNELLLFDHLSRSTSDPGRKKMYPKQLRERINVLYGSTLEAYIEFQLIQGILRGEITTADDLDRVTANEGSKIFPELFRTEPEHRGLWMLLETNFSNPLHNVNDMLASALAIDYFQRYKKDQTEFTKKYVELLRSGYSSSPANLLRKLGINIRKNDFMENVVRFTLLN